MLFHSIAALADGPMAHTAAILGAVGLWCCATRSLAATEIEQSFSRLSLHTCFIARSNTVETETLTSNTCALDACCRIASVRTGDEHHTLQTSRRQICGRACKLKLLWSTLCGAGSRSSAVPSPSLPASWRDLPPASGPDAQRAPPAHAAQPPIARHTSAAHHLQQQATRWLSS